MDEGRNKLSIAAAADWVEVPPVTCRNSLVIHPTLASQFANPGSSQSAGQTGLAKTASHELPHWDAARNPADLILLTHSPTGGAANISRTNKTDSNIPASPSPAWPFAAGGPANHKIPYDFASSGSANQILPKKSETVGHTSITIPEKNDDISSKRDKTTKTTPVYTPTAYRCDDQSQLTKTTNTNMIINNLKMTTLASLSALAFLLGGCALPDLKPFADSTASLHQATVQTRDIVKSELREFADKEVLTDPADLKLATHDIPAAFDARIKFMEAVVDYSDSLAAVADAAKNGRDNAKSLGDSLQKLAEAVGPYGAAVGQAVPIFVTIAGTAEEAWAVHSLRDATRKAQPVVQRGAEIMATDMTNVQMLLNREGNALLNKLDKPNRPDMLARDAILELRKKESENLTTGLNTGNTTNALTTYVNNVTAYDKILVALNLRLDPYQKNRAEIDARLEQEKQMVKNTLKGFQQWAKVHADLAKSLEENRQPNLRELISTVLEIKTEIEALKKH